MDSAYMGDIIMALIGRLVWKVNMAGTAQENITGADTEGEKKGMKKNAYEAVMWQHEESKGRGRSLAFERESQSQFYAHSRTLTIPRHSISLTREWCGCQIRYSIPKQEAQMEPKAVPQATQHEFQQLLQGLHDIDGEAQSRKAFPLNSRRDQGSSSSVSSMRRKYVKAEARASVTSQGLEEHP